MIRVFVPVPGSRPRAAAATERACRAARPAAPRSHLRLACRADLRLLDRGRARALIPRERRWSHDDRHNHPEPAPGPRRVGSPPRQPPLALPRSRSPGAARGAGAGATCCASGSRSARGRNRQGRPGRTDRALRRPDRRALAVAQRRRRPLLAEFDDAAPAAFFKDKEPPALLRRQGRQVLVAYLSRVAPTLRPVSVERKVELRRRAVVVRRLPRRRGRIR